LGAFVCITKIVLKCGLKEKASIHVHYMLRMMKKLRSDISGREKKTTKKEKKNTWVPFLPNFFIFSNKTICGKN